MERWYGKTAIVTGAAGGFGNTISEHLIKHGVKVVGLDLHPEEIEKNAKQLKALPGQLYGIKADISVEDDVIKAFDWAEKNVGPIHILINNAGVLIPGTLVDGEIGDFKKTLDVNVLGICICAKHAIKRMTANGIAGHIVNTNSITGHYVPYVENLNLNIYPATKHAVTALVESLRQELNTLGSNIKISSISPGFARTHLAKNYPEDHVLQSKLKNTPLTPQHIAEGVVYLLSTPPEIVVPTLVIRAMGEKC